MDYREFRDRYQYDSERDVLGRGGFGRVYRARDVLLKRWVALKIFSRDVPDQYDLISEITRAIDLNHRNVCRYYGAEVLKGTSALGEAQVIQVGIMEYVTGGTVGEYLKANPHFTRSLLIDILRGLSYLHQHQPPIIHRDLKPSNVLVGFEDGLPVAKITDFGISKSTALSGTDVSAVVGTYAYMAPEQLNPTRFGINGRIHCNLDLWSFGAMMMELLTGVVPFGGGGNEVSAGQTIESIMRGPSAQTLESFEEPYRSVLRHCMVPDAGRRAESAAELIALLGPMQTMADGIWQPPVAELGRIEATVLQTEYEPSISPGTHTYTRVAGAAWPRRRVESSDRTPELMIEPPMFGVEEPKTPIGIWVWAACAVLLVAASLTVWLHRARQPQPQKAQALITAGTPPVQLIPGPGALTRSTATRPAAPTPEQRPVAPSSDVIRTIAARKASGPPPLASSSKSYPTNQTLTVSSQPSTSSTGSSQPPVPAPAEPDNSVAQPKVPAERDKSAAVTTADIFQGTWAGTMQSPIDGSFPVMIQLGKIVPGNWCGILHHPPPLDADGKLFCVKIEGKSMTVSQTIIRGRERCLDGLNVLTLIDNNTMERDWIDPATGRVRDRGLLKRQKE